MFLLDTDTTSGAFRGQPQISQRILKTPATQIWICSVVVEESVGQQIHRINTLRSKRHPVGSASRLLAQLMTHLCAFQILPYSDETDIDNRHDNSPSQAENYLACDGHVKYIKIPYISFYGSTQTSVNNLSSTGQIMTFNYL